MHTQRCPVKMYSLKQKKTEEEENCQSGLTTSRVITTADPNAKCSGWIHSGCKNSALHWIWWGRINFIIFINNFTSFKWKRWQEPSHSPLQNLFYDIVLLIHKNGNIRTKLRPLSTQAALVNLYLSCTGFNSVSICAKLSCRLHNACRQCWPLIWGPN